MRPRLLASACQASLLPAASQKGAAAANSTRQQSKARSVSRRWWAHLKAKVWAPAESTDNHKQPWLTNVRHLSLPPGFSAPSGARVAPCGGTVPLVAASPPQRRVWRMWHASLHGLCAATRVALQHCGDLAPLPGCGPYSAFPRNASRRAAPALKRRRVRGPASGTSRRPTSDAPPCVCLPAAGKDALDFPAGLTPSGMPAAFDMSGLQNLLNVRACVARPDTAPRQLPGTACTLGGSCCCVARRYHRSGAHSPPFLCSDTRVSMVCSAGRCCRTRASVILPPRSAWTRPSARWPPRSLPAPAPRLAVLPGMACRRWTRRSTCRRCRA